MTALLAEALCTLRRAVRRRTAAGALVAAAGVLVYAGFVRPVASARDALSASAAVATLVLLVVTAGIVSDDVERGRLALAATHPVPAAVWVAGRWLAALAAAGAAFLASCVVLLLVVGGAMPAGRVAAGSGVAVLHLAALAALAVALSCRVGSTAQLLVLLALLVAGAMPPEIVGQAGGPPAVVAARAAWTLLPTSWALDEVQAWALGAGAPRATLLLALALQPALWLAIGGSRLAGAQLAERRD